MKSAWQKVKESERMWGDEGANLSGQSFHVKRKLTKVKARLLKRDGVGGGLGAEGWHVACCVSQTEFALPVWAPQALWPRHEASITVPMPIATT